MSEPVVLAKVDDGIAELILNRPKVLNSLNTDMVTQAYQHYSNWSAAGSGVRAILLSGAGGKAFCAGGDVRRVALDIGAGNQQGALSFFRAEYLLDGAISQLQLPHIALLDGITMGGGAGISMHGHFRVATEKTLFAMPETAIGMFPDVGMMALLPHLPGQLGAYLALTGARLTGHQVKEAGLATHYIPSSHLPRVRDHLHSAGLAAADLSAVNSILCDIEQTAVKEVGAPKEPSLQRLLPVINRCFGHHTVGGVAKALGSEKAERAWCEEALTQLQRASPLAVAVTLSYFQRARAAGWGPLDVLQQDYVLCGHFTSQESDFYEGVRARLIDKDDKPRWKHSSVDEVPDDLVSGFFRPRPESDVLDLKALLQQHSSQLLSRL